MTTKPYRVNEWGETYEQWGEVTHSDLVELTGLGLGDIQDDLDLGELWLDGNGAEEIAEMLGLFEDDDPGEL